MRNQRLRLRKAVVGGMYLFENIAHLHVRCLKYKDKDKESLFANMGYYNRMWCLVTLRAQPYFTRRHANIN